jgi:hypothetical protein
VNHTLFRSRFAAKVPDKAWVCCYHTRVCSVENQRQSWRRTFADGWKERLHTVHAVHSGCPPIDIGDTARERQVHRMPLCSAAPRAQKIQKKNQQSRQHCARAALDSERIQRGTVLLGVISILLVPCHHGSFTTYALAPSTLHGRWGKTGLAQNEEARRAGQA